MHNNWDDKLFKFAILLATMLANRIATLNSLSTVELSGYFDYIENRDVFFTIVMLMLVCYNRDSYSSVKDP